MVDEKTARLAEIERRLSLVGGADEDDPPIDQGILPTLALLNALGFNTILSCEGHVWSERDDPEDEGPNYGPYVEIASLDDGKFGYEMDDMPKPRRLWWSRRARRETELRSLRQEQELSAVQKRMIGLLQEFYASRTSDEHVRLVVSRPEKEVHCFTLASQGAWIKRSGDEELRHLQATQREMAEFTSFLHQKYFAQ